MQVGKTDTPCATVVIKKASAKSGLPFYAKTYIRLQFWDLMGNLSGTGSNALVS